MNTIDATFILISALTLGSAIAGVSLQNPVHCALSLAVSLAGIALLYLRLNAQFVGFAQLLVYIGAVAILIVFAVLLTRSSGKGGRSEWSSSRWAGITIAAGLGILFMVMILKSETLHHAGNEVPADLGVRQVGQQLVTRFVMPLEAIGLLLTAAAIGAVILAMREKSEPAKGPSEQ